jgi:integrase
MAVRSKLKGGKFRYVPLTQELAAEFRRYPAVMGEERIFPPEPATKGERQRVDKSFETILTMAGISDFRFHDLRHHADFLVMPTSCAGTRTGGAPDRSDSA